LIRHFCTYFDHRYLPRGLALVDSLRRHCPNFRLWVLCFDDLCLEALRKLAIKEVLPVALAEFEQGDAGLLRAKGNRSMIEYYFTCTPSLPLFILKKDSSVDMVTYLDADLFFFASPEPLFEELGDNSIAIIGHRFPPAMRHFEQYGVYNVGWLTFRRDERALACLRWWRERCLEWCFDRVDAGRFADQKYLDDWPARFPGVSALQHKGANLASWNLANYSVGENEKAVFVDGQPLIFFHFHHLKQRKSWLFETDFAEHKVKLNGTLKRRVFTPYFRVLEEKTRAAARVLADAGSAPPIRRNLMEAPSSTSFRERLRRVRQCFREVVSGSTLLYWNGRVC
jgi:hypothetical protein